MATECVDGNERSSLCLSGVKECHGLPLPIVTTNDISDAERDSFRCVVLTLGSRPYGLHSIPHGTCAIGPRDRPCGPPGRLVRVAGPPGRLAPSAGRRHTSAQAFAFVPFLNHRISAQTGPILCNCVSGHLINPGKLGGPRAAAARDRGPSARPGPARDREDRAGCQDGRQPGSGTVFGFVRRCRSATCRNPGCTDVRADRAESRGPREAPSQRCARVLSVPRSPCR